MPSGEKMSRQSRQKVNVASRIDALEKIIKSQGEQLTKLYTLVSKMKNDFDNLTGMSGTKTPRFRTVYGVGDKKPNPWALQASLSLARAMSATDSDTIMRARAKRVLEPYQPTLKALRSAPKGLTADEVKERTGRSRNTESAYLWRLCQHGYLVRERKRGKVVYKYFLGPDRSQ